MAGWKNRQTLLWYYIATGLAFDLVLSFVLKRYGFNRDWLANTFVLVEFSFISLVFGSRLNVDRKYVLYFVLGLGLLFAFTTYLKGLFLFNALGASMFSFAYILYAIAGFYFILRQQKILFLDKSSFFWINVAFLIYASGNLLVFLFKDYLREYNEELFVLLWIAIFRMLNILKNIFLALALSPRTTDK